MIIEPCHIFILMNSPQWLIGSYLLDEFLALQYCLLVSRVVSLNIVDARCGEKFKETVREELYAVMRFILSVLLNILCEHFQSLLGQPSVGPFFQ